MFRLSLTRFPISFPPQGVLTDYVPDTAPMIPPLLVHCVSEIEQRGLHEVSGAAIWFHNRMWRTWLKNKKHIPEVINVFLYSWDKRVVT